MTRLRVFLFRLRALVRSRQMDRDLDDEIASHLAEATEEYVRQGLSPEEARRAAQRSFGGVTQTREVYREVGSFMWLEDLCARLAPRTSHPPQESGVYDGRRSHAGAGDWRQHRDVQRAECGAAPAASLSRPRNSWRCCGPRIRRRTFTRADRHCGMSNSGGRQSQSFADMATFDSVSTLLTAAEGAEQIVGASISPNLLSLLGVQPALGRSFSIEEAEQAATRGPDQSSLLAGAIRRLARCARRDARAQRLAVPDHRHPPR